MTYQEWRRTPLVPLDVLTRLVKAGLGDVPQPEITPTQFEDAMRGDRRLKGNGRVRPDRSDSLRFGCPHRQALQAVVASPPKRLHFVAR